MKCVDLTKTGKKFIVQTYKMMLCMDIRTIQGQKFLKTLSEMDTKTLIENTELSAIINQMYKEYKWIVVRMECLYALQGIFIACFVIYYENELVNLVLWILMMVNAAVLILFEYSQFKQLGWGWYFQSTSNAIQNTMELIGNLSVFLLFFEFYKPFVWLTVIMVLLRAVQATKIQDRWRTLNKIVVECIRDMIPFLSMMLFYLVSFAIFNTSIELNNVGRLDWTRTEEYDYVYAGFLENLGNQYTVMFGENPGADFEYEGKYALRWTNYVSF